MFYFQLEKLQEENAAEWHKCERLESEKSALDRENKRLKIRILELEEVAANAHNQPNPNCNTGSTSSSSEGWCLATSVESTKINLHIEKNQKSAVDKGNDMKHSPSLTGIGSTGTCGTGDLSGTAGGGAGGSHSTNTKAYQELKQAHSKLKRVLQEKTVELSHALRRAESFEQEVKKLRARIEELKSQLDSAQDEVRVAYARSMPHRLASTVPPIVTNSYL